MSRYDIALGRPSPKVAVGIDTGKGADTVCITTFKNRNLNLVQPRNTEDAIAIINEFIGTTSKNDVLLNRRRSNLASLQSDT